MDYESGLVTRPHHNVVIRASRITPSALARHEAEEISAIHASRLDRARKAAAGWGAGAAAMLGLITTLSVVKGRDTIEGIAPIGQVAIGFCLLIALVLGLVSIARFTRAAYGSFESLELHGDPGVRLDLWRQAQYQKVRKDVKVATRLTYTVIGLSVLAVALSWVLPR